MAKWGQGRQVGLYKELQPAATFLHQLQESGEGQQTHNHRCDEELEFEHVHQHVGGRHHVVQHVGGYLGEGDKQQGDISSGVLSTALANTWMSAVPVACDTM